eukprot:TRINITY_DN10364_c0_g1_i1.p4 TRINITY_DN10364_c0_g1~~TRINITY_DN10364_c0_g1_i1.p4  ORF type:complete len:56 (+),score=8.54 TRINITY_DN10364_c0_g1_i1:382-549(+)
MEKHPSFGLDFGGFLFWAFVSRAMFYSIHNLNFCDLQIVSSCRFLSTAEKTFEPS